MKQTDEVDLRELRGRRRITLKTGQPFELVTRQDYIDYLVEKNHIRNEDDLIGNSELVKHAQRHWHKRGISGCRFAQVVAHNKDDGWGTIVITGVRNRLLPMAACQEVDARLTRALGNPNVHALSFLFPSVASPRTLADLVQKLSSLVRWSVQKNGEVGRTQRNERLLALNIRVRVTDGGVISWVLGFGPFQFLPNTRQSPFTELALMLREKELPMRHPDLNDDKSVAHLADLRAERLPDSAFNRMMASTPDWKRQMLEGQDNPAARARVTFAIPEELLVQIPLAATT